MQLQGLLKLTEADKLRIEEYCESVMIICLKFMWQGEVKFLGKDHISWSTLQSAVLTHLVEAVRAVRSGLPRSTAVESLLTGESPYKNEEEEFVEAVASKKKAKGAKKDDDNSDEEVTVVVPVIATILTIGLAMLI